MIGNDVLHGCGVAGTSGMLDLDHSLTRPWRRQSSLLSDLLRLRRERSRFTSAFSLNNRGFILRFALTFSRLELRDSSSFLTLLICGSFSRCF